MNNFHPPRPGDKAMFYCMNCKKSFSATVPGNSITDIFNKLANRGQVKCPDCKKPCGLDPKIKY